MTDPQQDILSDIVEQPQPARIGKRIAASIIDGLILLVILIILGKLFGDKYESTTYTISSSTGSSVRNVETSSGVHLSGWPAFAYMVCWFFLIPFMEGRTGQTLGKKAIGIRVIRQNGDPTNIGLSFVRHLFDGIDCFFLIGLIIASTNSRHARIGDLVAGTTVVA